MCGPWDVNREEKKDHFIIQAESFRKGECDMNNKKRLTQNILIVKLIEQGIYVVYSVNQLRVWPEYQIM